MISIPSLRNVSIMKTYIALCTKEQWEFLNNEKENNRIILHNEWRNPRVDEYRMYGLFIFWPFVRANMSKIKQRVEKIIGPFLNSEVICNVVSRQRYQNIDAHEAFTLIQNSDPNKLKTLFFNT